MSPVLKRIVGNGLAVAAVLGVIGVGLGELAATALIAETPARVMPVETAVAADPEPDGVGDALRTRVPVMMAVWGLLFVAGGELILARRRRLAPPPEPTRPDPAEALLAELLREAEAKARAAGDNTPTPEPVPVAPGSGG